jgi:hypothetical protein
MITKSKAHFLLLISIIFLVPFINGCSGFLNREPTPTLTTYPTIRPPKATRTPTATQTKTPLPSFTPTVSATPTLPPPLDDFSQAVLYASGAKPGWNFSLTILLPEPVKGEYNALIGDPAKPFTCRSLTEYRQPERLYCFGRIPAADKQVDFRIIEKVTNQVVFQGNVYVPIP